MRERREIPVLYIVVPCYNEEEVLPEAVSRLTEELKLLQSEQLISPKSSILLVDDGSRDRTWALIESYSRMMPGVGGLKLAGNSGHQAALLAGLLHAKESADCVVSMDADLQDDVGAVRSFVRKYREGFDVVYGVRGERSSDTFFKRFTAQSFYKFMNRLGVPLIYNHADYRLMSRAVLQQLERYKEVNLFLRGIIPLIGFRSVVVTYDRGERFAGESKYPLRKMLAFALDGITSFSVRPIRWVTLIGFLLFAVSIVVGCYVVVRKWQGATVSGWSSLMVSVWFIGGVQLVALGLVGEYIGKIYREVKRRPLYHVEEMRQPSLAPELETSREQVTIQ
ncbi:glycosyltransferase family 2 protein [Paenibacillus gansuensis]|uniref:Glycosyltransferase family 2 protein n=1 Tax=Paenibacillus gansuensis TaxID=306542 RepID=A0ABW5PIU0_9BACL